MMMRRRRLRMMMLEGGHDVGLNLPLSLLLGILRLGTGIGRPVGSGLLLAPSLTFVM